MLTAQTLIERSLRAFADRVAVVDGDKSITYATLDGRSARIANALVALGASEDRPLAIYLPNDFHFVELDVACMRAGITRVGIGNRLSPDECTYIINHSCSSVLVTNQAMLEKLDRSAIGDLSAIVVVDKGLNAGGGDLLDYENMIGKASDALHVASVGQDHSAYILYTSGTTGRPKGAGHTHGSRVAALVNMLANEIVASKRSAMIHCAPLTHGTGSKILSFLALGARNIILPRFDAGLFAKAVTDLGGTHSFMVPTMLQMLLDAGPKVRDAVRGMSQVSFGGAPITDAAFGRALEGFGSNLVQVYGTSEVPHPVSVLRPEDYIGTPDPSIFAETAGRASHGTEVRTVGDDGVDVAQGSEGELWIRVNYMMKGYWKDTGATAEVLDADGWYKSGDVSVIDPEGFIRFKDRKRDLIISGGLNVYPSEVERVIAEHPNVREVAVIGFPDDRWGESVMACIVPREAGIASAEGLSEWLEGRIAGYKKPRKFEFLDDLPKGATNKVLKRELRDKFWSGMGRRIN